MNENIDEELKIMEEIENVNETVFSADTFKNAISELNLHKVRALDVKASIKDAINLMQKFHIGSVVITENEELVGIITERDILMKVVGLISDIDKKPVSEIMTEDPLSLREGDMLAYVLNNMHVGGYRHVPIVDESNRPVSMVSIKDVMNFILDCFPEDITNITGEPYRGPIQKEGA